MYLSDPLCNQKRVHPIHRLSQIEFSTDRYILVRIVDVRIHLLLQKVEISPIAIFKINIILQGQLSMIAE